MNVTSATILMARRLRPRVSGNAISRAGLSLVVATLAAPAVLPATAGATGSACARRAGTSWTCLQAVRRGHAAASGVVWGTLSAPALSAEHLSPLQVSASVTRFARQRTRPWFRYPASTFIASETPPGARLTGMVLALNAESQPVYRCSGTVVNSPDGSLVWTAGHCIISHEAGSGPYPHFEFSPGAGPGSAWDQPSAPFGVWPVVAYATTRDWAVHGSARHFTRDFGALLVARNAQGQTISQVLGGSQHISFGGRVPGRVMLLGYPAAGGFTNNDSLIGCGPRPIGHFASYLGTDCAMTQGSSGGPWLARVNRRGIGTVVSVTSVSSGSGTRLYGGVQKRAIRGVWASLAHRAVPGSPLESHWGRLPQGRTQSVHGSIASWK